MNAAREEDVRLGPWTRTVLCLLFSRGFL
jgi:hypothetical protein